MDICGWEDQRGSGTSVSLISCGGGGGNASWMWMVGQDRTGHTAEHEEGKGVHGQCGQVPANGMPVGSWE